VPLLACPAVRNEYPAKTLLDKPAVAHLTAFLANFKTRSKAASICIMLCNPGAFFSDH
jgi:hypothetical protein